MTGNAFDALVRPGVETWQRMIALSAVAAVALLVVWTLRDGFSAGDVVGAAVTGLVLFAVLVVIRRVRKA